MLSDLILDKSENRYFLRITAMDRRERQILCGLFLSKFDQDALDYLDISSFTEAFNVLGYALRARPASIKNYRDEFDPYFPNRRQGWHKRPLRKHCQQILYDCEGLDILEMGGLIQKLLMPSKEIEHIPQVRSVLEAHEIGKDSSFARRLITGKSAEEYFSLNFKAMPEFDGLTLTDTTSWGCGFDFKLTSKENSSFCAVEVKGLRQKAGPIQLTQLEHDMAGALQSRYYLVIVRNFAENPFHTLIKDPLHSTLCFSRKEREEVRVTWNADIRE
jgi:hypothetical protein